MNLVREHGDRRLACQKSADSINTSRKIQPDEKRINHDRNATDFVEKRPVGRQNAARFRPRSRLFLLPINLPFTLATREPRVATYRFWSFASWPMC
jgi:hypothetical protein